MLLMDRRKFVFTFFYYFFLNLAVGQTKTISNPISCSEVDPENFNPQPAYVRNNGDLSSSVRYTGTYEECSLDGNGTLRIELERVFNVSDIGIWNGTKLRNAFEELLVTATIKLSSNETANSSCLYRSSEEEYGYFRCNSKGPSHDYGGFMASAIEISLNSPSPVSLKFNKSSTWMFVVYKPNENHKGYEKQCREPGKYATQTLDKWQQYYKLNDTVKYNCKPSGSGGEQRKCGWGGKWLSSPPRCLPTNRELSQPVPSSNSSEETNHEAFYYFHEDFDFIASVTVSSSLDCAKADSGEYALWLVHRGINTTLWKLSSSPDQSTQGCIFTFFLSSLGQIPTNYTNCSVQIKSNNEPIESVTQVSITSWNQEVYDWMSSGCPPIDPYIGMPDEYAGQAAMNPTSLNENLLKTPCRDGYWLNNTEQFKSNERKCVNHSGEWKWTGTIPKCILLTCKTPPDIAHGYWKYSSKELFHKVQYTCEEPRVPSNGHGVASCNFTTIEWIDVPTCDVTTTTSTTTSTTRPSATSTISSTISGNKSLIPTLAIASGAGLLIVIFLTTLLCLRRKAAQESASNGDDNTNEGPAYAAGVKSRSKRQSSEPLYANTSRRSLIKNEEPMYSNVGASATHDPSAKTSENIIYCELEFSQGNASARVSKKAEQEEEVVYASIVK